jgi:hypothetical protein
MPLLLLDTQIRRIKSLTLEKVRSGVHIFLLHRAPLLSTDAPVGAYQIFRRNIMLLSLGVYVNDEGRHVPSIQPTKQAG